MAAPSDEALALALGFQSRRFACDRCHRHKLKCERGPILTSSGIALPFGSCKRCGKAGVACTTSNSPSSSTATSRKENATRARTPSDTTRPRNIRTTPTVAREGQRDTSNDYGAVSPFGGSLFDVEQSLDDPGLYLETFDFDHGNVGGDTMDATNISPDHFHGSQSPERPQMHAPAKEPTALERAGTSMSDNLPPIPDFLSPPQTDNHSWSDQLVPAANQWKSQSNHADLLEETLNKLSELQSFIFREFRCIEQDDLARTFLSTGPDPSHGQRNTMHDSNLVGKVIYASERMIDIIASCGGNDDLPTASALRSRSNDNFDGRMRSLSDFIDDDEAPHAELSSSGSSEFEFSSPTADMLTNHLAILRNGNFNSTNGRPPPLPPPPRRSSSTKFDIPVYSGLLSPAKLTLMVCHVSLLGVYRSILAQAFEMLRTPLPSPTRSRPRSNKRSSPYNTPTAGHQSHSSQIRSSTVLGMRIQLEVITHMLERIDDSWAAALRKGGEFNGGRHRDTSGATKILLQCMLAHGGFEVDHEGDEVGLGYLMLQVKHIKRLLRSHSAL